MKHNSIIMNIFLTFTNINNIDTKRKTHKWKQTNIKTKTNIKKIRRKTQTKQTNDEHLKGGY